MTDQEHARNGALARASRRGRPRGHNTQHLHLAMPPGDVAKLKAASARRKVSIVSIIQDALRALGII